MHGTEPGWSLLLFLVEEKQIVGPKLGIFFIIIQIKQKGIIFFYLFIIIIFFFTFYYIVLWLDMEEIML